MDFSSVVAQNSKGKTIYNSPNVFGNLSSPKRTWTSFRIVLEVFYKYWTPQTVLHHSRWWGWSTITRLITDKATRCRYLDGSAGTLNASGLGLYQTLPGRGWKLSNCYLCLLFGPSAHLYCFRASQPVHWRCSQGEYSVSSVLGESHVKYLNLTCLWTD